MSLNQESGMRSMQYQLLDVRVMTGIGLNMEVE
jgi:hypothetical protein